MKYRTTTLWFGSRADFCDFRRRCTQAGVWFFAVGTQVGPAFLIPGYVVTVHTFPHAGDTDTLRRIWGDQKFRQPS